MGMLLNRLKSSLSSSRRATSPYRSSLSAGPQGYIPYPHRTAAYRFELVNLLSLGHVKGSTGVHHLCARSYFSSSPACLVRLIWIVFWWVVGSCTAAALWGAVSRTCPILLATFLCSCRQAFFPQPFSQRPCCSIDTIAACKNYLNIMKNIYFEAIQNGVRSTSLMCSFLLLQQCPACLVRLIWIVFVMSGR